MASIDSIKRLIIPTSPGAFRLFLAMIVFASHFSSLAIGVYAVYVFFVLSGFWLQKMWSTRYIKARSPYLTYMMSRLWRLAPTMALVSVITVVVLLSAHIVEVSLLRHELRHLVFSTLFLIGYVWLDYLPVGSAWSLDIEMQFYILAPLLSLFVANRQWRMVLFVLAAACSLISAQTLGTPILPKYALFFVVGMIAAKADWKPSRKLAFCSASVSALLLAGILLSPVRGMLIGGAHPGPFFKYGPACNIVLGLLSIPFAIYTTREKSDQVDRMMADLSYIVYLLHWPAMQLFFLVQGSFMHRLPYAAAAFAVVLPAAWLIWRYYDKPINHARAKWVASRIEAARTARIEREVSAP